MWLIYFLVISTARWVTTTWAGGGGQFQWQDTTMYLYSDGLCGRRFPGELMLYAPSLSDPHLLSIDSLSETHCIVESPDGRIFAGGRKQGIGVIYVSEDGGYTWSETAPLTNTLSVNCISRVTEGKFVAGTTYNNNRGYVFLSEDGVIWTVCGNYMGNLVLSLLVRPDGYGFAGTGNLGYIYWTPSAEDWYDVTSIQLGSTQKVNYLFQTVSGGIYAATTSTGGEGRVFFSDDGGTDLDGWHLMPSLFGQTAYSIAEDDSGVVYIGTGDHGKVFTIKADTVRETAPTGTQRVYSLLSDFDGSVYLGATTFEHGMNAGKILLTTTCGREWNDPLLIDSLTAVRSMIVTRDGRLIFGGEGGYIGICGHRTDGYLVSSVYDVGVDNGSTRYTHIEWVGDDNGRDITVKVRTGSSIDTSLYTPWGDCTTLQSVQSLEGVPGINSGDRYVQYRIELSSPSSASTPVFHTIGIFYNVDSIGPIIVDAEGCGDLALDSIDLVFSEPTNSPDINGGNIDGVLSLSGGHSWLSENGFLGDIEWLSTDRLRIKLASFGDLPATVGIGDTIYPDSSTIIDAYGNPCFRPCVVSESSGIEEIAGFKLRTAKLEVSPNPFRERTVISYQLPVIGESQEPITDHRLPITLSIYDLAGRLVKRIYAKN